MKFLQRLFQKTTPEEVCTGDDAYEHGKQTWMRFFEGFLGDVNVNEITQFEVNQTVERCATMADVALEHCEKRWPK